MGGIVTIMGFDALWTVLGIIAILIVIIIMVIFAKRLKDNPAVEVDQIDDDEDVKISDGHFSNQIFCEVDLADEAAKEFLMQKEAGNIEQAGILGNLLAEQLWKVAQDLIMKDDGQISDKDVHQQIILQSYTANVFIAENAPTSLLAETTLSVFYKKIEELSQVLYKHVSDTSAFSFYILNQRDSNHDIEVGRIYAKLCDQENNADKIQEGNEIYRKFYDDCMKTTQENITYKC